LNISSIGLVVTNEIYLDPRMTAAAAAIRTIGANRDRILGIKMRVNGRNSDLARDLEVLKGAPPPPPGPGRGGAGGRGDSSAALKGTLSIPHAQGTGDVGAAKFGSSGYFSRGAFFGIRARHFSCEKSVGFMNTDRTFVVRVPFF
jgi:hypothetical protein